MRKKQTKTKMKRRQILLINDDNNNSSSLWRKHIIECDIYVHRNVEKSNNNLCFIHRVHSLSNTHTHTFAHFVRFEMKMKKKMKYYSARFSLWWELRSSFYDFIFKHSNNSQVLIIFQWTFGFVLSFLLPVPKMELYVCSHWNKIYGYEL